MTPIKLISLSISIKKPIKKPRTISLNLSIINDFFADWMTYSIKGFFYQWAIVPNIVPFIVNSMLIILAFLSVNQFYYKKKLMA